MVLFNALDYSHELLQKALKPGDRALDATAGNGHDTAFLAELVGKKGQVISLDIQNKAIQNTEKLLREKELKNRVELIQGDHSQIETLTCGPFQAAAFNLGYLPRSDKEIVTQPEKTLVALEKTMEMVSPGGIITVVAYWGHCEGRKEVEVLEEFLPSLDQKKVSVLRYSFINQAGNPPILYALEMK